MKRTALLALVFCFTLSLYGCGDSEIDLVKNGNFWGYKTTTIGKMLDGTFEKTKWSSQKTTNGEILLLFEGKISRKMHEALKARAMHRITSGNQAAGTISAASNAATTLWQILPSVEKDGINQLVGECVAKYPTGDYGTPEQNQRNTEEYRRMLAEARAKYDEEIKTAHRPWAWEEDDRCWRITSLLNESESRYAIALAKSKPGWEQERNACGQRILDQIGELLDEQYWATGDTVFFEWKIHSNGKDFELSRFGAKTMPPTNLEQALKMIYEQ